MGERVTDEWRIPVGISSCLTGEQVRYNGGHKRSRYCLEVLAERFALEPFCPELEAGLGVPLAVPIRLLNHYLKRHGSDYIRAQTYLDPHPYELGLRNTI